MLSKIKSFIGYNTEDTDVEQKPTMEESSEHSIDTKKDYTKKETIIRVCDCCNESEISIISEEMFIKDHLGRTVALYKQPKISTSNGSIYDEVAICDNCFSTCETDIHKQYVWLAGKMNSLYKEIVEKENLIVENNNKIEEIGLEAEAKINKIMENSTDLDNEISNAQKTIEFFAQEQSQLESQL